MAVIILLMYTVGAVDFPNFRIGILRQLHLEFVGLINFKRFLFYFFKISVLQTTHQGQILFWLKIGHDGYQKIQISNGFQKFKITLVQKIILKSESPKLNLN